MINYKLSYMTFESNCEICAFIDFEFNMNAQRKKFMTFGNIELPHNDSFSWRDIWIFIYGFFLLWLHYFPSCPKIFSFQINTTHNFIQFNGNETLSKKIFVILRLFIFSLEPGQKIIFDLIKFHWPSQTLKFYLKLDFFAESSSDSKCITWE